MQPFYVYMLKCSNGLYYVGHTDNLDRRLDQHMTKVPELNSYVSQHLPFELVFVECTGTRAEAFEAERRIKKWSRKKKEALIEQNWEKLSFWSKKKF
jgi:tRNA/rRNA methyltransferase